MGIAGVEPRQQQQIFFDYQHDEQYQQEISWMPDDPQV
jgi:hypothetical protein